jgi:hypothetical protein
MGREANLLEPSFARVSKIMTFPKEVFIRKFGEIHPTDFENISKAFIEYYSKL